MAHGPILADYLFVGAAIEARLRAEVDGLSIRSVEQLSQAVDSNTRDGDCFVLWERDLYTDDQASRAGTSRLFQQVWTVLLARRDASQVKDNARNAKAGPTLAQIHTALNGFVPEGATRPLLRTNGRQASYGNNLGLYPLTFSITLNI